MKRIASHEEESLHILYSLYGQKMYAYAISILHDPDQAEDVLQECLVVAWQKASQYHGQGRLIAWLLGIIHHKSVSLLRRASAVSLDEVSDEPTSPEPSPPHQAEYREKSQIIQHVLQTLSPEHRMVLQLVFYQHLSMDESAKILKCPVGTVKSRLNYAKQMLRGSLTRAGFQPEDL